MIKVSLYIYVNGIAKRLDLFDDEKISITSSIQNINDISKTFTDYTNTYSLPASVNNNAIFKHWYNNDVENGFDQRQRVDAYIELDSINFRTGKIQLESVDIKDNKPSNYKVTFFGSLVSLKDTFNGLYLKDLNTGTYDFTYNGTNVGDKVFNQTSDDIKFPLITSLRTWNTITGSADNITSSSTPIQYGELFPALRLSKVFNLIELKFGITFDYTGSTFLTDDRFTNAFLLLKNSEKFNYINGVSLINYQTITGTPQGYSFNLSGDFLNFTYSSNILSRNAVINITNTVAGVPYTLYCYKDGVQFSATNLTSIVGTQSASVLYKYGNGAETSNYTFLISTNSVLTFTSTLSLNTILTGGGSTSATVNQTIPQTSLGGSSVANNMPDIKIEDFFTGILKMFNLTCYSDKSGVYKIEQLEIFYSSGNIIDISKYTYTDVSTLDRSKVYNKVNFKYEPSENLISTAYLSNNGINYGDLIQDFVSDGSEYSIKLPFETPLFSSIGTNLPVGFLLKNDLKPYIPKPIILYDYNSLITLPFNIYFNNGISTAAHNTYNGFGNETVIGSNNYSLNFGQEQSPLSNTQLSNSLYNQYYDNYLSNVFNQKSRLYKIKALLPLSIITTLRLKDRVIIRDKRYIINSMNMDLTTGETQFELLTDFR